MAYAKKPTNARLKKAKVPQKSQGRKAAMRAAKSGAYGRSGSNKGKG